MKLTSPFLSSGASASTAMRTPTALGSRILVQRTIRSCPLPGSAQRCLTIRSRVRASAIVREYVLLRPTGEVEQSTGGQEVEAGLGKRGAILASQPLVELVLELVEKAHVTGSIVALRVAELVGAPVAGLLLLRDVDVQKVLDEILEAVPVGVGAHEARGRSSAVNGRSHDPEVGAHDADIETREMIQLQPVRIGEQRLQIRRRIVASAAESDEMLIPLSARQLHQAQPVAPGDEAHRFGVDSDRPIRESHIGRQVFLMQMDRHFLSRDRLRSALVRFMPALPVHPRTESL